MTRHIVTSFFGVICFFTNAEVALYNQSHRVHKDKDNEPPDRDDESDDGEIELDDDGDRGEEVVGPAEVTPPMAAGSPRIADGEPLILRKNISVPKGLYNGRLGKARWRNGQLYFECTDPLSAITITHSLTKLKFGTDYQLAYAITIHKAQGLTLNGINIGLLNMLDDTKKLNHAEWHDMYTRLFYVALTRVRSFENVHQF